MPGDPNQNMGLYGGAGAQGGDRQAIADISDQAKQVEATRAAAVQANAAAGLKAAFGDGQMPQPLDHQIADHVSGLIEDPKEKMVRLGEQIADLEKQAKDIEKSGTGNIAAMNAYLQVAQVLKARLHGMQSEQTGLAHPQATQQNDAAAVQRMSGRQNAAPVMPANYGQLKSPPIGP